MPLRDQTMYTLSRQPSTALANSGYTKHSWNKFLFPCLFFRLHFFLLFCTITYYLLSLYFCFTLTACSQILHRICLNTIHHTQKAGESVHRRSNYMCTPRQNKAHPKWPYNCNHSRCVCDSKKQQLWTQAGLHWLLYISTSARDYILFRYIHCVQVRVIRCHL